MPLTRVKNYTSHNFNSANLDVLFCGMYYFILKTSLVMLCPLSLFCLQTNTFVDFHQSFSLHAKEMFMVLLATEAESAK